MPVLLFHNQGQDMKVLHGLHTKAEVIEWYNLNVGPVSEAVSDCTSLQERTNEAALSLSYIG